MWYVLNPDLPREQAKTPEMAALRDQTPTREWLLLFREATDEVFVVREWPNGSITACTLSLAPPTE